MTFELETNVILFLQTNNPLPRFETYESKFTKLSSFIRACLFCYGNSFSQKELNPQLSLVSKDFHIKDHRSLGIVLPFVRLSSLRPVVIFNALVQKTCFSEKRAIFVTEKTPGVIFSFDNIVSFVHPSSNWTFLLIKRVLTNSFLKCLQSFLDPLAIPSLNLTFSHIILRFPLKTNLRIRR